jgi:hypothetical protein
MGGTRCSVDSAYLLPVHREFGPRDDRPHIHESGGASVVHLARLHGQALPCGNSDPPVHGELPNWPEYDVWQVAMGASGDL